MVKIKKKHHEQNQCEKKGETKTKYSAIYWSKSFACTNLQHWQNEKSSHYANTTERHASETGKRLSGIYIQSPRQQRWKCHFYLGDVDTRNNIDFLTSASQTFRALCSLNIQHHRIYFIISLDTLL